MSSCPEMSFGGPKKSRFLAITFDGSYLQRPHFEISIKFFTPIFTYLRGNVLGLIWAQQT
jgi:hypothetical protein